MDKEIWIWAEHEQGEIREASLEVLGEARRLANKIKGKVCAFLFGEEISGLTGELASYGADVVYLYEDSSFKELNLDLYLKAFSEKGKEGSPQLILISATPNGISLAPRLAARLQCGYAANTVTISMEVDNRIKINRSAYLDKAQAVFSFAPNNTVVVTMKPGSLGLDKAVRSRKCESIAVKIEDIPASRTEVRGFVKADPKVVSLGEAERVAAAGAGFRDKDDVGLVWKLAEAIGAAVGGSKPTVDRGWIPHSRLVGQSSGRRLSPRLFVAVGVSGTNHFVEGMKDSRLIIAINKDKGAPIMKLADLAAIGDLHEVLPEIIGQINRKQEGAV
ncbi:MAG: electron transfer flavoprotein subunit alpha/FixB family protein [Dehalobacter sp.]|nr:electron transfer flavoprotein subunit alpha/FixB family protein [Dehalobacter sp.]